MNYRRKSLSVSRTSRDQTPSTALILQQMRLKLYIHNLKYSIDILPRILYILLIMIYPKGFTQVLLIIVLLFLAGGATYYFGVMKGNIPFTSQRSTPKESTKPTVITPTTVPTTEPLVNWKSYQFPKTEFSSAFILYYPPTWRLETTQAPIKLSKGSVSFEIKQGPGSVGACLFEDDKNNANAPAFASVFPSYRQIKRDGLVLWRLATSEYTNSSEDNFFLCEKLPGSSFYIQYTSIGYVPFNVPQTDTVSIAEIEEILSKIKVIN